MTYIISKIEKACIESYFVVWTKLGKRLSKVNSGRSKWYTHAALVKNFSNSLENLKPEGQAYYQFPVTEVLMVKIHKILGVD